MDVHVRAAITAGLRRRAIDVLTAQEDQTIQLADPELLDRASVLGRVVFTNDVDFLVEAAARQRSGQSFAGLIFAHQLQVTIGQCVNDLELLATILDPTDVANQVVYLPL
jgi:hypothetical protein